MMFYVIGLSKKSTQVYFITMVFSTGAQKRKKSCTIHFIFSPVLRYVGNNGSCQNSMSVRFNQAGTHILALRRRMAPVLYAIQSPDPVAEFYHQDYYNSCTMKSCCFAGKDDQFVLSGSDDFNLYMWKVPDTGGELLGKYHSQ